MPKRHFETASTYAAEAIALGRPLRARPHLFRSSAYDQCRATLRAVGWQLHLAHRRKDPEAERKFAAMREKLRKQCNRMHNELLAMHQRKVLKELEQSQKCDKSFWKAWDRVRGTELGASELPKAVKCADGSIATNFANFVHAWSQHFASLGVPNRPATDSAREFADGVRAVMAELDPDLNEHARAKLECPITPDELAEHMRRLKRGKAVGHDQLPAEVLRLESPGLINALVLVFNRLLELVVWPTEWWYGLIVPIAKPGADRSDPNDYRGITVLPVLSKLFESVINERVAAFLEHTSGLSDLQGGFRANRGTVDQIFLLHEAIAQYRERKQPLYVAFLDVAKAYDKCWREGLAFRMRECGLTARIIHFFRQTQANVQRSVVVRGHTAPPIRFDTGVPQGAVTSPVLYAMFIDGLARELERSECGAVVSGQHLPALLYADDIALLASSRERLQRLLDICSDYALRYQFEFNAAKSNVVMIASKAQCERAQHQLWTLQASRDPVLKQAQHYKYLGVIMGNTGEGGKRWQPTLDALNRKAMGSARVVQQVAGTGKRAACVAVQIKLFRAIVVPALEYACAVWGPALSGTGHRRRSCAQRCTAGCTRRVRSIAVKQACAHSPITVTSSHCACSGTSTLSAPPIRSVYSARCFEVVCARRGSVVQAEVGATRCAQCLRGTTSPLTSQGRRRSRAAKSGQTSAAKPLSSTPTSSGAAKWRLNPHCSSTPHSNPSRKWKWHYVEAITAAAATSSS